MDAIQVHPFFTRRAPRPTSQLVAPPTPDLIDRPVAHVDDIDPDILSNLRTLWHGMSEKEVVDALISKECGTAFLICAQTKIALMVGCFQEIMAEGLLRPSCQYRTRHLEDFNMENEEAPKPARRAPATRKCPPCLCTTPRDTVLTLRLRQRIGPSNMWRLDQPAVEDQSSPYLTSRVPLVQRAHLVSTPVRHRSLPVLPHLCRLRIA